MARRAARLTRRERKIAHVASSARSAGESIRAAVLDARRKGVEIRTDGSDGLPKISETFNEYAAPLLETLPDDANRAQLTDALSLAYACWNIATGSQATDDECVARLLALTRESKVEANDAVQAMMRTLIVRRREEFSWDPRTIAAFEVIDDGDDFRIVAVSVRPKAGSPTK